METVNDMNLDRNIECFLARSADYLDLPAENAAYTCAENAPQADGVEP